MYKKLRKHFDDLQNKINQEQMEINSVLSAYTNNSVETAGNLNNQYQGKKSNLVRTNQINSDKIIAKELQENQFDIYNITSGNIDNQIDTDNNIAKELHLVISNYNKQRLQLMITHKMWYLLSHQTVLYICDICVDKKNTISQYIYI